MRKSRKKKNTSFKGNTFLEADYTKEILNQYSQHPWVLNEETRIAQFVKKTGESIELHMYYRSFITSVLWDIVTKNKIMLARYEHTPAIDFGGIFVVDVLTEMIYNYRKKSLGLKSLNISSHSFSFYDATKNCNKIIDLTLCQEIFERIEAQTVVLLTDLELDKEVCLITPLSIMVECFTFHKILAAVFANCLIEGLDKVDGVDTWAVFVATYEIAHRIYNNYEKSIREKGIA